MRQPPLGEPTTSSLSLRFLGTAPLANPVSSTAEKNATHPECQPIEELLGQEHLREIEAANDVDVFVPVMQFMYSFRTSGPSRVELCHSRIGVWREATYFGTRLSDCAVFPSYRDRYEAEVS